ncbi:MAG: polysaccharide deacetylase family protein [Chitinophagaceae bacterium]
MLSFTNKVRSLSLPALLAATLLAGTSCQNGKDKRNAADTTKVDSASIAIPTGLGSPITYEPGKRYIFLAFDDGPQPPGTVNCKNIFHEEGVKATFFLVAAHAFDPMRKRIVDSLNNSYPEFVTGNHSSTHGFHDRYPIFYKNVDSAVNDILKAQNDLNLKLKIVRLPGMNTWASAGQIQGPKSSQNVAKKLDSLGYTIIGWDTEWQFVKGSIPKQGAEELAAQVNKKFDQEYTYQPNTLVILAHDRMFAKPQYQDSLRKFITILKQDKRNVFETLDHYPTVQNRK